MICLLGRYTFYDFADPENDPASIESGEIKFITQDTVVAMLEKLPHPNFKWNYDLCKIVVI